MIHEIEGQNQISNSDIEQIENKLKEFLIEHRQVLKIAYEQDIQQSSTVTITDDIISELTSSLSCKHDIESFKIDVLKWIYQIKLKPASELLGPLVNAGKKISEWLMKDVDIVLENAELLIDEDQVGDFLKVVPHIIRNSIDHGIEAANLRGKKPATASLRILVSEIEDSHWQFVISDDGQGINTDKLVQKAIDSGLLTPSKAEKLSHNEKLSLIFLSSLSTAEDVTDISGRGIGMHAVKEVIEGLKGEIAIESFLGKGTTLVFSIPKKKDVLKPTVTESLQKPSIHKAS